ncbi:zf-HC2 domain-containing protein [Streptomyces sp. NPDC059176]|uniref:zf-HC2 domain-containing protein n=1 Tax=Streptomyces sp. NPDC059176 TaxID=3346758 RepID=UPI00369F2E07
MSCEQLREIGAELSLGVLPGRERADAVAHLDRCADCREYIEQLTLVGDGLLGLLPDSEPPVGFESQVARRLGQVAAAHDGPARGRVRGFPGARLRGRLRVRVVAVAAALALAFGFGGWAVGTVVERQATAPAPRAEAAGLLHAVLTAETEGRQPVGEVYVHHGPPGWVYMSVDLDGAGSRYSGKAVCVLERVDGTTVRGGSFTLNDGYGYWGAPVPAPVDPATLSGVRLTSADGTALATARFGVG